MGVDRWWRTETKSTASAELSLNTLNRLGEKEKETPKGKGEGISEKELYIRTMASRQEDIGTRIHSDDKTANRVVFGFSASWKETRVKRGREIEAGLCR